MPKINPYQSRLDLAQALAKHISEILQKAIDENGSGTLAVSGGSTPLQMFGILSRKKIDWHKVTVTLVDDRWVSIEDPRSNEKLVRENLLQHEAGLAKFISLHTTDDTPKQGLDEIEMRIAQLPMPFDAIILGMGTDGHTASFFSRRRQSLQSYVTSWDTIGLFYACRRCR